MAQGWREKFESFVCFPDLVTVAMMHTMANTKGYVSVIEILKLVTLKEKC
jgi:hypothetical protein